MANIEIREKSTRKGKEATYKVTVVLGRKNGKRIRKSRTYHFSDLKHTTPAAQYKEVQELAESWEKELKGQKTLAPKRADKVRFEEIIGGYKTYINSLKDAGELSRRTASDYISQCDFYCVPYFKGRTIESIGKDSADDFLKYLRDEKKLAPSSRKKILACIRKVFKYLVEDVRIVSSDPFRDCKIVDKKGKSKSKIGQAWSKDQIELFSKILTTETEYYFGKRTRRTAEGISYEVAGYTRMIKIGHMWVALFLTAMTCGFRPGELRGLTWQDVDFDSNKIRVRQAISSVPGEADEISTTKTISGVRTLIPSAAAMESLRLWREDHENIAEKSEFWKGKKLSDFDDQLVFCSKNGSVLNVSTINKKFHKIVDQWNNSILDRQKDEEDPKKAREYKKMLLPRIRAYDLRHTYGTIESEKGTPANVLAGKMGHTTPVTTYNNYVHVGMAEDAPNQFDSLIPVKWKVTEHTDSELTETMMLRNLITEKIGEMSIEQLKKLNKLIEENL